MVFSEGSVADAGAQPRWFRGVHHCVREWRKRSPEQKLLIRFRMGDTDEQGNSTGVCHTRYPGKSV